MSLKDADVTETECGNCECYFTTDIDLGINGRKVTVHVCKKDTEKIINAINEEINKR